MGITPKAWESDLFFWTLFLIYEVGGVGLAMFCARTGVVKSKPGNALLLKRSAIFFVVTFLYYGATFGYFVATKDGWAASALGLYALIGIPLKTLLGTILLWRRIRGTVLPDFKISDFLILLSSSYIILALARFASSLLQ